MARKPTMAAKMDEYERRRKNKDEGRVETKMQKPEGNVKAKMNTL